MHERMVMALGVGLLGLACTGRSVPRAPEPVQLAVRVAEARHADQVDKDIFVWPTAPPTEAPDEAACMWWSGDSRGRDVAIEGLNAGTLRWAALVVTRSEITFAGQTVVSLDGQGRVPADQVRADALVGLGAVLGEARDIQDAWFEACGMVYRDRPLLVVDEGVPVQTVHRVLSTLSRHRFPRVAALVGDRDPENRAIPDMGRGVLAVLRPRGAGAVQVLDSLGTRRFQGPPKDLESMLARATPAEPVGCALVVPDASSRWAEVVAHVDTVTAFGARSTLLYPPPSSEEGVPAKPVEGRTPSEWLTVDSRAAVHWLDTPVLEPVWEPVATPIRCEQVTGRVRKRLPVPALLTLALSSPGADPVQPCRGQGCVPLVQPLPGDSDELPPVTVGWRAFGALELPDPDAADSPLAALVGALKACPVPAAIDDRRLARAVGWVEVGPDGKAFDAQVGVLEEAYKPWARCLGQALQGFPTLPPPSTGTHAAVEVLVDGVLAPRPATADVPGRGQVP